MKVLFSTNGTGPYTIHQEGDRFLIVSHRGPKIHVAGKSEEEVHRLLEESVGAVTVEEYSNNVFGYEAILDDLKAQSKVYQ